MASFFRMANSCSAAALLFVFSFQQANAQTTRSWTNTTNSNSFYDIGTNWSPVGTPGASDLAQFVENATYQVWWDSVVGNREVDRMAIGNGDVTFRNGISEPQYELSIAQTFNVFGGSGTAGHLTNYGLHMRIFGPARIGGSMTVDGSHPSGSRLTKEGSTGIQVDGRLNVVNGGNVDSEFVTLSGGASLLVEGPGSRVNSSIRLDEGVVTLSSRADILDGGVVNSRLGTISQDTVLVSGAGSQWNVEDTLQISAPRIASLEVGTGGLVTVGGETTIGSLGNVNMTGGRFEFGQASFDSFSRIGGTSGSLAGNLDNTGFTDVSTLRARAKITFTSFINVD